MSAAAATLYARNMREGRRAARAEHWQDAARSFEAAFDASSGDGRAAGELGWALFHTGDFAWAAELTSDALDSVDQPNRRAMLLYDLGRILEQTGGEGAARVYLESLRLRWRRIWWCGWIPRSRRSMRCSGSRTATRAPLCGHGRHRRR